jgi:glycosyltransferase involved in cell wall biosynthesis
LKKLAIITTHPIQYNAPLFTLLGKEDAIDLKVFYTWGDACLDKKFDPDFGKVIQWDIPLLDGYNYSFVNNIARNKGSHHFFGIDNPSLIAEVKSWGADIVWVWGWSFKSHLQALRYFKGKIPVWFRGDSVLIDEKSGFSGKQFLKKIFLKWVYKHINKAFYVGEHNKNYFLQYGLSPKQLVYAPHAIDTNRFQGTNGNYTAAAASWRNELGIQESDFVVLFAGKLEPKKNPEFLLNLASTLSGKQFKFVFVGNGILEAELKEKSKNDSRIIFLDFQNQMKMPVVYRLANVFILPSVGPGETWGLALNEAIACGIPIMASTKCGGAIDLIDASCGLIFESDELEKAVDFIQELQRNPNSYHDFCKGAAAKSKEFMYQQIIAAVKIASKIPDVVKS